ncbi:MAG: hypothetical protein H0V19_00105 [Euzebyales bacterium]|nr:hypothetical protein [Euzebyales bacterium]
MTPTTLPSGQAVFDPRGAVDAQTHPLAPRPAALDGLRLAVLDNSKWNAGTLLRATVATLDADFAEVTTHVKESFSRSADEAMLDRIASGADVVVTAVGD